MQPLACSPLLTQHLSNTHSNMSSTPWISQGIDTYTLQYSDQYTPDLTWGAPLSGYKARSTVISTPRTSPGQFPCRLINTAVVAVCAEITQHKDR